MIHVFNNKLLIVNNSVVMGHTAFSCVWYRLNTEGNKVKTDNACFY